MWWEGDGEEEEEATKEVSRKPGQNKLYIMTIILFQWYLPSDNTEDTKMFVWENMMEVCVAAIWKIKLY